MQAIVTRLKPINNDPEPTASEIKLESLVSKIAGIADRMCFIHAREVPTELLNKNTTDSQRISFLKRRVIKLLEETL